MGGQIRAWEKRDESIANPEPTILSNELVLTIEDDLTFTLDRLETILELRSVQEVDVLDYAV